MTAQCRFNKVVRGDGCPLAVNFDKSTLVNQFTNPQHVDGGLVQFDENTIVDLSETEKLQNFANLWGNLIDTTDTHDKSQLGFGSDVKVASFLSFTGKPKFIAFSITIFFDIFLSTFEYINTFSPPGNAVFNNVCSTSSSVFLLPLATLQDRLWDGWEFFISYDCTPCVFCAVAGKPH